MTNQSQIQELIENWAAAVRNRDMAGILAHHADDVVMFDVPPPFQSLGIVPYRNTWDLFFKYSKSRIFNIQQLNVIADDNVAFCYANMKCAAKSDTGEYLDLPFRLTIGLKKIAGQWTIVHEHHSLPTQ